MILVMLNNAQMHGKLNSVNESLEGKGESLSIFKISLALEKIWLMASDEVWDVRALAHRTQF